MEYLGHPYFDASDRADWLELPIDHDGNLIPSDIGDSLDTVIRRDFDRITKLVLDRLTKCSPDEWLAECPHALLNDVSYCPVGDGSARIFVEYAFRPSLTENSYHTDSWWAIVLCPYVTGNPYTDAMDYVIEHFGWSVQ
ncbi:hypothetical protein Pla22_47310 [Rubripirellula amarantea]|uniref:Uncharacterized protein n=1 Tax=Rubripirellula amarantea TaxID=2527999 RepID=A0A5C5WFK1_9BACT|nr:hypothetical protein [Rubripirellula amarantea]TWT49534.1 hypothetical protein Pla22_47310 [Rubripirellula amarantea]